MRELCNAFVRRRDRATVPQMLAILAEMNRGVPELMYKTGAVSVFEARIFEDLLVMAAELREEMQTD